MVESASAPLHPILVEEQEWREVAEELMGAESTLISVSAWIGDSRTYRSGDIVATIRRRNVHPPATESSLATGVEIAMAAGRQASYVELAEWEGLVANHLDGTPLSMQLTDSSVVVRLRVLARVVRALRGLHRSGIAHGDLRPDNILVLPGGSVELIDFDRAVVVGRRQAWLIDFLGIGGKNRLTENPFWSLVIFTLAPRSRSLARRIRTMFRDSRGYLDEPIADPALELLRTAWQRAQSSPANAPGQGLAYYGLTFRKHHFPGERPWALRWEYIRDSVDFSGKRVVELGCNLALLSAFARIHGAAHATAVDHDPRIIDAARDVARAFDVDVEFQQVDLTSMEEWEERLRGADVVTAMSLLHWLPDKRRVLNFIGKHREVIYEGHDPLSIESERLKRLGFDDVRVLARTERGRHLLHALRS